MVPEKQTSWEGSARERAGLAPSSFRSRGLASFAWFILGYTVLVILWGAFVRATGSGAGCGSHWPLCNGEVIPRAPRIETLIELGHRLSSGLLGILVLLLVVWTFRARPRGHVARKGAMWVLFFVVSESLLGAGLVTFEWVAANDSVERVYVMAFHLVNTFLLLAAMTSTAWFLSGDRSLDWHARPSRVLLLAATAVLVLVVGSSGAVTALGDTLFLTEGVQPEESPVLARLLASRVYHPALAVAAGLLVAWVALGDGKALGRPLVVLFVLQLGMGALNVYLRAPVWMQLVHLAVSDIIWILLVLMSATVLAKHQPPAAGHQK